MRSVCDLVTMVFRSPPGVVASNVRNFIPACPFGFAFATLTSTLRKVFRPVEVVRPSTSETPTWAHSGLVIAMSIIAYHVELRPMRNIVFRVRAWRATTPTIGNTKAPSHFLFCQDLYHPSRLKG